MEKQLVYDIGAHRGDDSDVYLKMGYRVVAVEANPSLAAQMNARFANEIERGEFTVLNYLIWDEDNKAIDFYIASDSSKSSTNKTENIQPIQVNSQRLGSIIAACGKPYYCKIDIEDADLMALKSLNKDLPSFISVEVSGKPIKDLQLKEANLFETVNYLHLLGYKKFKLVDQEHFVVLNTVSHYQRMRSFSGRIKLRLQKQFSLTPRDIFRKKFQLPKEAELSGYPSDQLKGCWMNYEETLALLSFHFKEYCSISSNTDFIFWVDVHASLNE